MADRRRPAPVSDGGDVQVFRVPLDWWQAHQRADEEVLSKLGLTRLPHGGWTCDEDTARRLVATVCAFSFDWRAAGSPPPTPAPTEDELRDEIESLWTALADLDSEHTASARIAAAMATAVGWETPGETWVDKAAHLAPLAARLEAARELRAARNGEPVHDPLPAVAVHPGEMLRDELDERGMTQAQLAERLGHADASQVSRLCNGRADIRAPLAVQLERVLGPSAELWLRLQMAYDLHHSRRSPGTAVRVDEDTPS